MGKVDMITKTIPISSIVNFNEGDHHLRDLSEYGPLVLPEARRREYLLGGYSDSLVIGITKDLARGVAVRPVTVLEVEDRHFLQVGFNRTAAHVALGRTEIDADVFSGVLLEDFEDALLSFYEERRRAVGASAREPGYDPRRHAQHCSECANLAPDKHCLAWAKIGAPEGWKPTDAPRCCRGFLPAGSCLGMGAVPRFARFRVTLGNAEASDVEHPGGATLAEIREDARYRGAFKVEISQADKIPSDRIQPEFEILSDIVLTIPEARRCC